MPGPGCSGSRARGRMHSQVGLAFRVGGEDASILGRGDVYREVLGLCPLSR
jgi:hypothetical protein